MHPYTVLLLYPDYLNDNGDETYLAHVEAADPREAVTAARQQATDANTTERGCSLNNPTDMAALIVFPGHHTPALTAYDEPSPPTAGEHPLGTEIYYTGDVANQPGFGVITALNRDSQWGDSYDFTLEDGREIKGIATHSLGDKYEGHGGTRFVIRAAYDDYRAKLMERWHGERSTLETGR
jgi:hypothetical protein